jgi:hypothetical protein
MKMVLGIFVIVASVYLIAMLAPPFFSNYQFEDAIRTEAQMDTYNTKTEEQIADAIFKKAQELDVPVTREQIKVQRAGLTGTGSISIAAPYVVHISLPGYPLDLNFNASTRNKGVL